MLFFQVFFLCASVSIVSELIIYKLLYSTEKYASLKRSIIQVKKKLKEEEEDTSGSLSKQKKKIAQLSAQLSAYGTEASSLQFRSTLISAGFQFLFMYIINRTYDAQVVAKLPFNPFSFFQGITHKGLSGNDYTDCGALLIFVLNSTMTKPVIESIFGFALPKTTNGKSDWINDPEGFVKKWLGK
ncbi:hypothetical protein BB560_001362 [Smittium megazygosporum]|uniref:Calcium load-activated calcium channel n=1 Tax=Smittium megazygosporum TaxID=133381 RepID=A0A2T9ZHS8_9FUNG|nr:hypothetical protein BB560_001362 [Smittium megazygosporum]